MIQYILSREVQGAVRRLSKSDSQIAREQQARRPMLRLPLEGVPGEELLKQLELLKRQEEAQMKGGAGRSLGYAHTHDVGGRLGGHCALLLKTFKVDLVLLLCVCFLNLSCCVHACPRRRLSRPSIIYRHNTTQHTHIQCHAILRVTPNAQAFCEGSGAGPAMPELDRVLEVAFQVRR